MSPELSRGLTATLAALLLPAAVLQAEPHSKPISDKVIVWELSLPNGELIKHAAREGTMLKVRDTAEGWYYGFTPVVGEAGVVDFTVFEITEVTSGQHALRQVDQGKAEIGSNRQAITVEGFAIEVKGVAESKTFGNKACAPEKSSSLLGDDALATKGRPAPDGDVTAQGCCVTCGTTTVCNCAVSMGCGNCCSDPCCDPPPI